MSKIWHLLNIDSLANYAGFGLEYYSHGDFEKAKPLLMKGIEFCDLIQKGNFAITHEVINQSYLDAWEDIQILVKCKSPDELKAIVEEAVSVKIDLMKMVQTNATYSTNDIRKMQQFFIDASTPYLRRAHSLLRRLETCRRI